MSMYTYNNLKANLCSSPDGLKPSKVQICSEVTKGNPVRTEMEKSLSDLSELIHVDLNAANYI